MNVEQSARSGGYYTRLGVLLALLVVLGGILLYDRAVKIPGNEAAIGRLFSFVNENGDGLTREKVRQEAGFTPVSSTVGNYEVDHFHYTRALPFLPSSQDVYVVYENGLFATILQDDAQITPEGLTKLLKRTARKLEPDPNRPAPPQSAGGGRQAAPGRGEAPPPPPEPISLGGRDLIDGPEGEAFRKKKEAEMAAQQGEKKDEAATGSPAEGESGGEPGSGEAPAGNSGGTDAPAGEGNPSAGEGSGGGDGETTPANPGSGGSEGGGG